MEITEVPLKMQFIVKTTEAEKTYEQQRQNVLTLSQIYSAYGQQTIPLAMQLFGPQGMQMKQQAPELWDYMGRVLTGSGKLMDSIFKFFGIYDTMNYLPDAEKMDQMLDMMKTAAGGIGGMPQLQQGLPGQGGVGPQQGVPGPGMQPQMPPQQGGAY
jgi:hypothetical protein